MPLITLSNPTEQLTEHFSARELMCQCGSCTSQVDTQLLGLLESVRTALGVPLRVSSGYRCVAHNKSIGGEENSQHCKGLAADVQPLKGDWTPTQAAVLDRLLPGGLGIYRAPGDRIRWFHIDARGTKARWEHRV